MCMILANRSVILALALLAAVPAAAQDFNRIAPQQPTPSQPGAVVAPPINQPIVPPAVNSLLLKELKGLRLVDRVEAIVRTGVQGSGLIIVPELSLLNEPQIQAQLAAFLNKPLYANDLPRISKTILDWYRAHKLPVVDVAFPEQDINSGTVQAVVTVYRLGTIKVEGNRWFSSGLLRRQMQLRLGDPINIATLQDDLNRLSGNPFRQVNAVLERSLIPGSTDIDLKIQDRLPFGAYVSLDNNGLPATSRDEYSVGINFGNLFGLDHQLAYRFIASPDLWQTRNRGPGHSNEPRFMAHSATYQAPLPWGDTLNVFGAYVAQVPNLGPNFDQVGHSLQLSVRYGRALPTIGALTQQLQAGFDFKRSDNNLDFGGTRIFASATNVEQFLLIYDGTLKDRYGQTAIENVFVFSPGALSPGNTTGIFVDSGTTGAKATYVYDNLQITRVTYLPWDMSSVIRIVGQLSSVELLPSEQLGAGGADSVRGYDSRTANGTQGALFSFELRSPSFSPLKQLGADIQDSAQLLAFFDSGFVSYLNLQAGQPQSASLQSVGVGVRYAVGRYADLRFDYGWQLTKPPGATQTGSLASVSVTFSY